MTQHRAAVAPGFGRVRHLLREVVLTVGAVLGVVCLVVSIGGMAADVRPVIFRSGSMSPSIDTGALALTRTVDASDLAVGDVVTVRDAKGVRVTHRIRSLTRTGQDATLVLKGDANSVADESPYVVRSADRVLFDVPRLGYVVSAMVGPAGVFGAGLLVGLVLTTVFARRRPDADEVLPALPTLRAPLAIEAGRTVQAAPAAVAPRPAGSHGRRRRLVLAAAAVSVAAAVAALTTSTSATFTDQAGVSTAAFTMRPSPVTINGCVTNGGNSLTLTWTAPVSPITWELRYVITTGTPVLNDVIPGNLRTYTSTANLNNRAGTLTLVGIFLDGQKTSFTYQFSGNGAGRVCTLQP